MAKRRRWITAGPLVEECLCTVPRYCKADTPYRRAEKRKLTTAGRAALNRRTSAQQFRGLVFANFYGSGSLYLTLTYRDNALPAGRGEVKKSFRRFARRLKRCGWSKPLRYIYIPEHEHGEKRWHIHVILGGSGGDWASMRETIAEAWDSGKAAVERMSGSIPEVLELARYLTKERPEVGARGYIPSRGLRFPERGGRQVSDRERLDAPPGASVLERVLWSNSFGEFERLAYLLPSELSRRKTEHRLLI